MEVHLALAGGSVGADGELEMRGQSTLKLEGDITAAGTVDIDPNSVLNFGGKTLDVSGGKLKIGGARSFDSITTNASTDLQVNTYLDMSRSDSGTSTVGDLSIVVMQGHSGGNSLSASNMNLTVAGSASLSSQQLSQSNGILTFQSAPSFPTQVHLVGELVLANGGTVNGSSLQLCLQVQAHRNCFSNKRWNICAEWNIFSSSSGRHNTEPGR